MHTHANHYARQQQQLRRDERRSRPDGSLSMHVQVDGIEFNHRNDRPFFFGARGRLHEWFVATRGSWLMPHEEEPANLLRETRENHPCHKCELQKNPGVVVVFLQSRRSLSSLPPDLCLKELIPFLNQLKWPYLSHPDNSVISGQPCCWMRHLSKAPESCSGRCSFFCQSAGMLHALKITFFVHS